MSRPSSKLFLTNIGIILALALALALCNDARADGPGRFDLPVDLRGIWSYNSSEGCETYMSRTGTTHFSGGLAMCNLLPFSQMETHIYQDCLEMTITGKSRSSQLPLHHMILNNEYVTDDWTSAGEPASWTSKIVEPGPQDVDAVTSVVVFNIVGGADARRYKNNRDQLVQAWTTGGQGVAPNATFRIIFDKINELPCQGYDPTECSGRTYSDGEGSEGWTPACCLDNYGDHQPNPNVRDCEENEQKLQSTSTEASTLPNVASSGTRSGKNQPNYFGGSAISKIALILCQALLLLTGGQVL